MNPPFSPSGHSAFTNKTRASITVYTSIVGTRDQLRNDQNTSEARFIAFVDRAWGAKVWEERPACTHFLSSRRNSRAPKILAHQYIASEYSLWLDGRIALQVPAGQLVDEWLAGYDLAVFTHPKRKCLFDEAAECARRRLDRPEVIAEQVDKYERHGYPKGLGLAECSIILRQHTPVVEAFNNYWWSEYCRHSVRDQISFMYAAWQTGLRVYLIPGDLCHHPYFAVLGRPAEPEATPKMADPGTEPPTA